MKYDVKFETDEEDEDIFISALKYGLKKAGTEAEIIEINKVD